VGDALECDVVKRENEMTPLDARAGDHESMTNRELQMLHGYPRHESGAGDGPLHQRAAGRNSEPLHQRRQRVQRHRLSRTRNMQSEVYPRSLKGLVPQRQRSELATRPTRLLNLSGQRDTPQPLRSNENKMSDRYRERVWPEVKMV
jgi:hypothetical protein